MLIDYIIYAQTMNTVLVEGIRMIYRHGTRGKVMCRDVKITEELSFWHIP